MRAPTRIFPVVLAALAISAAAGAAPATGPGPALTLEGVPANAPAADPRLDDYLQARPALALGFAPHGEVLIRSRFGDADQLHLVSQEAGARRQLTFGREPVAWAAFSPDPARNAFVYLQDSGGDGRFQVWYQHLDGHAARRVSDGSSVNTAPLWSSSGHELAFGSTARTGQDHDIVIVDPEGGAPPRLVVAGDAADWRALDWAADDHLLLVLKTVSRTDAHLYLVDLANGQRREIDPMPGPVAIRDARLAPDGQGVYYLSDGYGDYTQLRYINIFTGQKSALSVPLTYDIAELALSRDGRFLAFVSNEGLTDRLNVVDLVAHQDLKVPGLPGPCVLRGLAFDADGRRLVFTVASASQPGDAWVLDIAAARVAPWTRSETGPVDTGRFVAPRLVRIPTFDRDGLRQREIPAWIYAPAAATPAAGARHPALVSLEAGPERPYRPGFDPWIQYLVAERGMIVVVPALRGTSGFGKGWVAAGQGLLLEDAIKDVGAVLVWLRAQRDVDAQRIAVSGRGLGGTLALDALVNYSDRVRAAVAQGAVSDLPEWLGSAGADAQARLRAAYGDERDWQSRAVLRRLSPLANMERISRPMLVAHGRQDAEVPVAQSDELIAVARSRNLQAWYLFANDEGHEFVGKPARDAFLATFAQFLASLP